MKKWLVTARIRADINYEEIVEAKTENAAVKKAEKIVYKRAGIDVIDVIDDEVYCEEAE